MSQVTPHSDAAPPAKELPLNIGTALAVAIILSLLVFFLTSGGESPVMAASDDGVSTEAAAVAAPPVTSEPGSSSSVAVDAEAGPVEEPIAAAPPTTVAAAESFAGLSGGDASRSASVLAMASDITNMGPTEVGFVTNFPSVEYTWERIEIAADAGYDSGWLGELNGRLVMVSPSWNEGLEDGGQRLITTVSADGLTWDLAGSFDLPAGAWVSRIVGDGGQIYALTQGWDEPNRTETNSLFTSGDGVTWSELSLELQAEEDEHHYVQNAAAGPAGLALAVSFESYPEQQPSLLDFGEYQVEVDHMAGTYILFRDGDEVLSGRSDEIFNWGGEGQAIFNPETGDLITVVPWETWESAFSRFYEGYGGGSPLPLPIHSPEPVVPPSFTIEYDGYLIEVDENAYEFSVVEVASGEEIAAGSLEYVYQGPPPRFVDPESGESLLTVTWDEWYRAEEESYRYLEGYYEYSSRTELLTSVDGTDWDSTTIPTRQGASVSYLIPTETGFVAMVNTYSEFGNQRSLWTFSDGAWSSAEADNSDLWLYQVAMTDDEFVAVGEGPGGPALWSSTDGLSWTSEFAIVPQDDGSYVSMTAVAAAEDGTIATLARREKWSEYQPLVMEKDGYTLTFEEGEVALRVRDAAGEQVLALGWESFEDGSDVATWEDGVTYIDLGNGEVIAITDDEAYAAMESRWSDQGALGLSVFLKEGARWAEAIVEVDGGLSGANQLLMVDDRIIIGGTFWQSGGERYHSEMVEQGSLVIIVGTPIGG